MVTRAVPGPSAIPLKATRRQSDTNPAAGLRAEAYAPTARSASTLVTRGARGHTPSDARSAELRKGAVREWLPPYAEPPPRRCRMRYCPLQRDGLGASTPESHRSQ